ncbi:MAG: NADH-quinone oxidoreductase subunit J [Chloroflexi bacterium]|nr:NADH-quinone oxidoreductase subunit J [Chloroflexota bacterium]
MAALMTAEQGIFGVAGAICAVAAVNAVFRKDTLAAAVSLVVTLLSLAVIYLGLGYEFLAAVQVGIYAGAIVVLFTVAIMILSQTRAVEILARAPRLGVVGPVVAALLFLILSAAIVRGRLPVAVAPGGATTVEAIADALFVRFLFPFEVTSVLLLAALVAAVVLTRKRSTEREWPRR